MQVKVLAVYVPLGQEGTGAARGIGEVMDGPEAGRNVEFTGEWDAMVGLDDDVKYAMVADPTMDSVDLPLREVPLGNILGYDVKPSWLGYPRNRALLDDAARLA